MITAFQTFLDYHKKISNFLRKKKTKTIPKPLVTAPEVTQDPDDMEKGDKVGSSIEGSKKDISMCNFTSIIKDSTQVY